MKYGLVVGALVGLLGTARAQAPGSPEPIASFLEHRVPEELAADGVVLSRRGLMLHVAQSGDGLVLALVDVSTQHVEASTKLDVVPVDREGAVTTTKQLVAGLAAQIATHTAQPVPDEHARELAELQFRRDAIRFGDDYRITVSQYGGSVHREWFAVHGELDQRLDPEEFYRLVDRPDLVEAYEHRHNIMVGGLVVGAAAVVGGAIAYFEMRPDPLAPDYADQNNTAVLTFSALLGVGAIGFGVATWYHLHPHPISENEAKQLAEQHNQALRRTLGLPVADVQITPVATPSSGGLALSGRF